ncbi:hypothetical protein MIR68_007017 [Amoeboaphelidium protococcarum]|nr:hypothetical protein MIR68_007017 [Amoeboaphelidium protococcarum]
MADQVETTAQVGGKPINEQVISGYQSDAALMGAILNKRKPSQIDNTSYIGLFKYADTLDIFLMFVGSLSGIAYGVIRPLIAVFLGGVVNALLEYARVKHLVSIGVPVPQQQVDDTNARAKSEIMYNILLSIYVSIGALVSVYSMQACWAVSGQRQAYRVRRLFLKSILSRDVQFFDEHDVGELTTRLSSDTTLFQEGISEKWSLSLANGTTFFAGFIIAGIKCQLLSVILIFGIIPVVLGCTYYAADSFLNSHQNYLESYYGAGAVAQETLTNIKTVAAFNAQERSIKEFSTMLDTVLKTGVIRSWKIGLLLGVFFGTLIGVYTFAFWFGGDMVGRGEIQGGDVLTVLFVIIISALQIYNAGTALQVIKDGREVAQKLFEIIESKPAIYTGDDDGYSFGLEPKSLKGDIEFKSVTFSYPSRKNQVVLKDYSLKVDAGKTVALVGFSGSGKSTIIQLLERFYDVFEGGVYVDGVNVKDLNLSWLRNNIALVSQEPILFDLTIEENVRLGALKDQNISEEDVISACKSANCHDFIMKLPQKYQTRVGEKGSLLSGGQRQRICIARSIIKKPKILLADEATSALDTESERIIQAALEKVSEHCTTIIIAHRLSTIKNADQIVVMESGKIVETGTHNDLIQSDGKYAALVKAQELKTKKGDRATSESDQDNIVADGSVAAQQGHAVIAIEHQDGSKGVDVVKELTDEEKEKKEIAKALKENKTPLWSVLKMQKEDWPFILVGVVSAGINGACLPLCGLIMGEFMNVFSQSDQELYLSNYIQRRTQFIKGLNLWSSVFACLLVVQFFVNFGQFACFGIAGQRMTNKVRLKTFSALLRQEIAFFDDKVNGLDALTARLSLQADQIPDLTRFIFEQVVHMVVAVGVAVAVSFYISWKMTLIVLAFIPMIIFANILGNRVSVDVGERVCNGKLAYALASQTACLAIQNIRTVKSLLREETFVIEYLAAIEIPYKTGLKRAQFDSISYAFSQAALFWVYSLTFYFGFLLIEANQLDVGQLLKVMFIIVFSVLTIDFTSPLYPDIKEAKFASIQFFQLLDRQPVSDSFSLKGVEITDVLGEIKLEDVDFTYPKRPKQQILKKVSLKVQAGQHIGICGSSGSGKSTIIQLIQRFYDPQSGVVSVERLDVKKWIIGDLRRQISIVSQEPILFIGTIAKNIAYGRPDASKEEIIQVAKQANIHDFISSLPDQYDTEVTNSQMSGGQKQLICIARALLCQPKILILDESTSALDSESEKLVQQALNEAIVGRTCITIAGRLSTIQNCDLILVMHDGEVVERGTHDELLAQNGLYATLISEQNLNGVN